MSWDIFNRIEDEICSKIDEELNEKIGLEIWGKVWAWKRLAIHIIMVLYCTLTYKNTFPSPLEEIKNEDEMNILLWAALFHDIAKTERFDTPDRSHPFLSAALTLQIF